MVQEHADVFEPGDHASTFGGNPFACRAGLTVAQEIDRRNLMRNVQKRGDQLREGLEKLVETFPGQFQCVRGWGLLQGVVMQPDCNITAPQLAATALNERLALGGGRADGVAHGASLSISAREIRQLLRRLEATCRTTFQI